MPDAVGSKNSTIMWGRGITFQGGDPSTDKNIPFNPMPNFEGTVLKYLVGMITTCDQEYHNIEYDEKLEEATVPISTYYRDPFFLLEIFTYKTVTGSWTGTGDVITGAYTNKNNQDKNLWIQLHSHDQSGNCKHINLLWDGGQVTTYRWVGEQGKPLIEEGDILFTELDVNTQPVDIDANFDDSKFDKTGVAEISTIVAVAAASIGDGDYFTIQGISAAFARTDYYVWFDKQGAEQADPAPTGYTKITCDISGDTTAQDVSDTITAAIDAVGNFGAANGGGTSETVTVTNANTGDVKDIVDVDSGLTVAVSTQGVMAIDGGWSLWDDEYTSKSSVLSKDVTITWGGSAISGHEWKKFTLELAIPKNLIFVGKQLKALDFYDGVREPYKLTLEGIVTGDDNIAEVLAAISSKTKATVKLQYGTTNIGYIQFTNGYLSTKEPIGAIPEAGNPFEATLILTGGADSELTFNWTGNVAQDPSNIINHTDS